jgi:carotenoid 1,2-hydratase
MAEHDGLVSHRSAHALGVGNSVIERRDDGLELRFDERTSPFPRPVSKRLSGTIRVRSAESPGADAVSLDAAGRHRWWPVAPRASVEVSVPSLGLRFSGDGYHDANAGDEPLGAAFRSWSWGRWHLGKRTIISYDVALRDGGARGRMLSARAGGFDDVTGHAAIHRVARTGFGLPLRAAGDASARPRGTRVLEDAPFYARALTSTRLFGEETTGVIETLDLDRFAAPWVRFLLPFRARRSR